MKSRITRPLATGLAITTVLIAVGCSSNPVDTKPSIGDSATLKFDGAQQLLWIELSGLVAGIDQESRSLRMVDSEIEIRVHEDAAVYYDDNRKPLGIGGILVDDRVVLFGKYAKDIFVASVVKVKSRDAKSESKSR